MTVVPIRSVVIAPPSLELADFQPDASRPHGAVMTETARESGMIRGVVTRALTAHADHRGSLCELLTTRDGPIEPIVHVYEVRAEIGSVRAWVYHRSQTDRLAFTQGRFRIVLYDIRPDSPTRNMLNEFILGRECPTLLSIPAYVIHGVQNIGGEVAAFVNMPTIAYRPDEPDKCRLDPDDKRIPFRFDG
jgi:dTDP-4-dehydrorhamnose 3,5-epimerase